MEELADALEESRPKVYLIAWLSLVNSDIWCLITSRIGSKACGISIFSSNVEIGIEAEGAGTGIVVEVGGACFAFNAFSSAYHQYYWDHSRS